MASNPAFQTAIADSKKLTSKPSDDDLLQLYGTNCYLHAAFSPYLDL